MFSKKYLKKTHQKYIFKNTDTKYFSKKMVGGEAPFAARRADISNCWLADICKLLL